MLRSDILPSNERKAETDADMPWTAYSTIATTQQELRDTRTDLQAERCLSAQLRGDLTAMASQNDALAKFHKSALTAKTAELAVKDDELRELRAELERTKAELRDSDTQLGRVNTELLQWRNWHSGAYSCGVGPLLLHDNMPQMKHYGRGRGRGRGRGSGQPV